MEKIIIEETIRTSKPVELEKKIKTGKKRTFIPKKRNVVKKDIPHDDFHDFVMRANEVPHIKVPKQVGSYKIGKSFHIFFEKKPNVIHRFFTKLLLGWKWHDQK